MSWSDEYIGIPYLSMGRDREGCDCWGLVRMVYRDRYGIELPGYSADAYNASDIAETAGLIAAHQDSWRQVSEPAEGDVVLLRIKGYPSHVGVLVGPAQMLHVYRDGLTACIERLDTGIWKHRIEGYYRHADRAGGVVLSGCPHPLKTINLMGEAQPGATLRQMIEAEADRIKVPRELVSAGHAWVDGKYIAAQDWDAVLPAAGQRVEYRLLPRGGNSDTRTILMIVVMIVVNYYAPGAGTAAGFTAGSFGAAAVSALAYVGMMYAGMKLVDAIAPVRIPGKDNSQFKSKYQLQGGPNNIAPYASLPVVLGKFRYTPPVAALPYVETTASDNYLRTVLCWGYGPLDVSDLRIGDTPLSDFEEVEIAHLRGVAGENKSAFNRLYGKDVAQESVGVKLETGVDVDRVTAADVDGIKLVFSFPAGLWMTSSAGINAGANIDAVSVRVSIQYRPTGVGSFVELSQIVRADTLNLPPVYDEQSAGKEGGPIDLADWWLSTYGYDKTNVGVEGRLPLYQWTLIALDPYNNIITRTGGPTDDKNNEASLALREILSANNYGFNVSPLQRIPDLKSYEHGLYLVCVNGETVVEVTDLRDASITGCDLSYTGLDVSIASGSIVRATDGMAISAATKSAFDKVVAWKVPTGQYDVRVRLITADAPTGTYPSGNSAAIYRDCYWNNLTGISNTRPIVPRKPMAMTALRIRATNQLNGSMEGITGTVKSVCLDYDKATASWVSRHTRNPASLFRYVLQHPASAVPVADAAINLTVLERWHNYCRANGFAFDMVITGQRPLLDVLKDIAAAGRASPQLADGQWSVVIDEPRTSVVQHFTPHNSWGFEGTRTLPKRPHALRITFFNAAKGYQADERIVYDDGYTSSNATLIEGIELPGVTDEKNVHAFGRFHLAQLALRLDSYTLNVDMEHLICTRGDKVRVTHDVPMWGLGSGRIREVLTSGADATGIVVDEVFPMDAGAQYTVRIRRRTGDSQVCDLVPAVADGYYSTLTFVDPITASLIAANDLVLYGTIDSESVELLVTGITPDSKGGARLLLVDYAPGVFNADEEAIPAYTSQITQPPLLMRPVIASGKVPSVKSVASDESALSVGSDGGLVSNILVSFGYAANLPKSVTHVLLQYGVTAQDMVWDTLPPLPLAAGVVAIPDVRDGVSYSLRMCYLDDQGIRGRWGAITTEVVTGKTGKPQTPTGLTLTPDLNDYILDWDNNPERDVAGYEVRDADANWGGVDYLWIGKVSQCHVPYGAIGVAKTYYVKAFDRGGRYSEVAASLSNTLTAPAAPAVSGAFEFDSYRLSWSVPAAAVPVDLYEILHGDTLETATSLGTIRATSFSPKANWSGMRRFWVRAIDMAGNPGAAALHEVVVTAPSAPVIITQVIDNNVLLKWSEVAGSLPITSRELRKGAVWDTAEPIGDPGGSVAVVFETAGGVYNYLLKIIDSAGNESAMGSIAVTVNQPPDYVLKADYDSLLNGTKSNMVLHGDADNSLIGPVNATETVAQHFTNNGWSTPQDQIDAGYPVYIQPNLSPAYYEETIDYGAVLAGNRITITPTVNNVVGAVAKSCTISVSADGVSWTDYADTWQIYATSFRYVKFRITFTASNTTDLIELVGVNIRLDSKLKTVTRMVTCDAADTGGTTVYLTDDWTATGNKLFIDVDAISLTPQGTTPVIPMYDFVDAPNPLSLSALLFDTALNRVSGTCSLIVRGF